MKGVATINETTGLTDAYQAAMALEPQIKSVLAGASRNVKDLFDLTIPLRPVQFWTPLYLIQLRTLCESMYMLAAYHRKEIAAMHEEDFKTAAHYNKLASTKLPMVRPLQATLQLTPTMIHGQAQKHVGTTKAAMAVHAILDDVNELYAQ